MRFTHLPSYPGLIRAPRSFNGGFVFLGGPTFLHMNTLAQPAGLISRDNQSMHERCCLGQSDYWAFSSNKHSLKLNQMIVWPSFFIYYYYYYFFFFINLTPACGYIYKATHFIHSYIYPSLSRCIQTNYTVWQNAMLTKKKGNFLEKFKIASFIGGVSTKGLVLNFTVTNSIPENLRKTS